ncbi:MAG: mechanosensitive ion channel [Dechloromonas sp.]|nr:mechanosensitive ion channel [Dechloromonas sp.]
MAHDVKSQLTALLQQALASVAPTATDSTIQLERPRDPTHGDWSTNLAMQLAKALKKNPREIANQLLNELPPSVLVAKAEVAGAGFINFSVNVNVAYGSDVEKVFSCLEQAMKQNKAISKKPKPFVRFTEFGESSLQFEMVFWSKQTFLIENVKSDLRRDVYKRLSDNGLNIPFPQRDVNIKGMEHMVGFKAKESSS